MGEILLKRASEILAHDLDDEFIKVLSTELAWRYNELFVEINGLALPESLKIERFGHRRTGLAVQAMASAAMQFKVPYNFRKLQCNGQTKLLVKMGRIVIIQEPILRLDDHPKAADYKLELARAHGIIRQLELDLQDQPMRIRDWSGCILATLLHAPAGPRFTERDRNLGALMLAVPDADYENWLIRLDLQRIAMFGFDGSQTDEVKELSKVQEDRVFVTPKRKNSFLGDVG